MSVISDPTVLDGQSRSPGTYEIEDLLELAERDDLAEAAVEEPEGADQLVQLQAKVALLEAQTALRAAGPQTRRLVRGRYRSVGGESQLELRVDVDGFRPAMRVSGDFFQTSGTTTGYVGSFVLDAPTVSSTPGVVRIEGTARFSLPVAARHVRVAIPRASGPSHGPVSATVHFSAAGGAPTATYLCGFVSPHFRSIKLEQDSVAGTVPFIEYNTGSLPQPPSSPTRTLTLPKAFEEAGIEVQLAGTSNTVPVGTAGTDAKWDEAELHNAMVNHFSLWRDAPLWQAWLLVATSFVQQGVRGVMFDAAGSFQRQGYAVFHDAIQGQDPATQRAQLRTYVHELGHAFNLLHSWDKNFADPPQPLGPNGGLGDLSWMNYTWKFQPPPPAAGGDAAYWAAFPFQFTDNELVHLRHGFFRDVVMGGNPFGVGAAEVDPELFGDPVTDHSGLTLELRSARSFAYGQPVVVELKLSSPDRRGRVTHDRLGPTDGFVTIAVRTPSGQVRTYRPPLVRCLEDNVQTRVVTEENAVYKSAYIGYGRDGLYFEQPGRYQLRAQYVASDGSRVLSDVRHLTVRTPRTDADEHVAELMMGDQQGTLFYLLGSSAESLTDGNDALQEVIERYGDHPLAVYPRLVKGVNASRDFKYLTADRNLYTVQADPQESIQHLDSVVEASTGEDGVDNLTLNWVMRRRARMEARTGDLGRAIRSLDGMATFFRDTKGLREPVVRGIAAQAEQTKERIAGENR
ncbi:hypothetical protein [Kitasatospora sp. NPDC051914]|uniref:hypothetical protein n=1 Tax=Kitasatospora sp. NPDC051914 TaxID=3154945 RepID=UPI00344A5628